MMDADATLSYQVSPFVGVEILLTVEISQRIAERDGKPGISDGPGISR